MPITQENLAELRNARQYADACANALRRCTVPGAPALLSFAALRAMGDVLRVADTINTIQVAAEQDAAPEGQK